MTKSVGLTLNESSNLIGFIEENMAYCNTINRKVEDKVKMVEKKKKNYNKLRRCGNIE